MYKDGLRNIKDLSLHKVALLFLLHAQEEIKDLVDIYTDNFVRYCELIEEISLSIDLLKKTMYFPENVDSEAISKIKNILLDNEVVN